MNYKILSVEYYLPEKIIDNEYLSEHCGIDADFLKNKIGIQQRHIAAENESTSEMATKAANKILSDSRVKKEDIDLLLVCTQHPDYKLPTTACVVQHKLGLKQSCISFDINLGCSGFVYSLEIAGNFIRSGKVTNALLIMVDQYSKSIDYCDKNTASIFGDAASATLISECPEGEGVIASSFGTDGANADKLMITNSGVVTNSEKSKYLYMDGREIFKFSASVVPRAVDGLLRENKLSISDINYFIFHQANKYMLQEIKKRLSLSDDKMVIDLELYGNTVSSSIPIALSNLLKKQKLIIGDKLILCGFGVGLSWGTLLYQN